MSNNCNDPQTICISVGGGGSPGNGNTPPPVELGPNQILDEANTATLSADDINPDLEWVGEWSETLSKRVVRLLVVVAATDQTLDGLGGYFTFEFSNDGINHNGVSETREILDFQNLRDFDLLNFGRFFRVRFRPKRALGDDTVFVATILRLSNDGDFVRLAGDQIEEPNAAMSQGFAYLKAFVKNTRRSINIRATPTGQLLIADFLTEVAKGNVDGHTEFKVNGRSKVLPQDAFTDIWLGTATKYSGQPENGDPEALQVLSSSNDDRFDGPGCQKIRVTGLRTPTSEIIETEEFYTGGTVGAFGVDTWWRVFSVEGIKYGARGENVGTITVRHRDTIANIFAQVGPHLGKSKVAAFTVPHKHTAYLRSLTIRMTRESGAAGAADVETAARPIGQGGYNAERFDNLTDSSPVGPPLGEQLSFAAGTDIKWRVDRTSDINSIVSVNASMLLVQDEFLD